MPESTLKLCAPSPIALKPEAPKQGAPKAGQLATQSFVGSTKVWPYDDRVNRQTGQLVLCVEFIRGSTDQINAVKETLKASANEPTWADFANVRFAFDAASYDIRVSFSPDHTSWSCVGTDAKDPAFIGKPTMNLGWLPASGPLSSADRATILHEFGHALGLMHEHQSPARGGFIHLKESAAYAHYLPKLQNDPQRVKTQVIDTYNSSNVAAFSKLDMYSIMMYPMPAELNEEGINITPNLRLSKLDRAFVTLMYPPDLRNKDNVIRFTDAMEVAGIREPDTGIILHAFHAKVPKAPDGDIRAALIAVREAFVAQNERAMSMYRTNAELLNQVDLDGPWKQSGIKDFFTGLAKNKLLTSVVKNVAKEVFQQNGIAMIQPRLSERDVMHTIGTLVTHPELHEAVLASYHKLTGKPLNEKEEQRQKELDDAKKQKE